MNAGTPWAALDVPEIWMFFFAKMPRNVVGTLAVKLTVEVTLLPVLMTLAVILRLLNPLLPVITALKMLAASVDPALISPSPLIVGAVLKAAEDCVTEPTAAASAAARSWLRRLLARL